MVENLKFEDTQKGLGSFVAKKKPVCSHSDKKILLYNLKIFD